MKKLILLLPTFIFSIVLNASTAKSNGNTPTQKANLSFKENKGQVSDQFYKARPDVLFSGTDGKLVFHLKKSGISYQLNKVEKWAKRGYTGFTADRMKDENELVPVSRTIYRLDVNWLNTASDPEIIRGKEIPGFDNYYFESCPMGALNVKSYADLTYKNIYTGIDLKWYEKNGNLKYDYNVSAYADYKQIKLELKGAEKISINSNGELVIKTPLGDLTEQKPLVTQNNKVLEANWVVNGNTISFDIKDADPFQPLTIDPVVRIWGTYYGSTDADDAVGVTLDNLGNSYLFGQTKSMTNVATIGAHQSTYGGGTNNWGDALVAKFDPTGTRMWATYYGGAQGDFTNYCAVDIAGNVYLTGGTSTTNTAVMATPGAHQSTLPGGPPAQFGTDNAFLVKFNSSGQRIWGTYYGGTGDEWAYYVAVNPAGEIVVSGATRSGNANSIATPGCHQLNNAGGTADCFLVKFNSAGVRQWGTYYGGSGSQQDDGGWCGFDSNGDIYLGGATNSQSAIATPGSQQQFFGGTRDAFIAKFNSAGVRQWGTYFGGIGNESYSLGYVDNSGNSYICGSTASSNGTVMTTPGAHQTVYGGATDGFLAKYNSQGQRQWSTYYGGAGYDDTGFPAIDPVGNIYVAGTSGTSSGTAIATSCAYQYTYGGAAYDAYFVKFTSSGKRIWGTYYGGQFSDYSYSIAVDVKSNTYLAGTLLANSGTIIATPNSYQPNFGGGPSDMFLVKFDSCYAFHPPHLTPQANLNVCFNSPAILNTTCGTWFATATSTNPVASGSTFTSGPIITDTTFYIADVSCGYSSARTIANITVVPIPAVTITPVNTNMCVGETVTLTASGAVTYTWNTTLVSSALHFTAFLFASYTVTGKDANGCSDTASIYISPAPCVGLTELSAQANQFINIFPNPSNGAFTIQSAMNMDLILSDELGRELLSIELSGVNNREVVIKELPNGVYFLNGNTSLGNINRKIIVLK